MRGRATEVADGDWTPDRLVVIEFESVEQARAWLNSPEYTEIKGIRVRSAGGSVIIAEGGLCHHPVAAIGKPDCLT